MVRVPPLPAPPRPDLVGKGVGPPGQGAPSSPLGQTVWSAYPLPQPVSGQYVPPPPPGRTWAGFTLHLPQTESQTPVKTLPSLVLRSR